MIYIGADHNGYGLKKNLKDYLSSAGYTVQDQGDTEFKPEDDFPVFAASVCSAVLGASDPDAKGILICGSGQGMCIAANRYKGIRATLCWDRKSAREARNDDDANVLCLPANSLDPKEVNVIVETWLNTPFAGAARFVRRLKEIDEL